MTEEHDSDPPSSSSEASRSPEFDPEADLLNRYEQMVQTQVQTLEGIDTKASTMMRVLALLLGVLLTVLTLLLDVDGVQLTWEAGAAIIWLGIGVVGLIISLAYSIYTYLSSRFLHGPREDLGRVMAEYQVDSADYRAHLLRGTHAQSSRIEKLSEQIRDASETALSRFSTA